MSWSVVARKEFQDASRSRALWGLTLLFVLFLAGFAYLFTLLEGASQGDPALSSLDYVTFLLSPAALLVPITALVITHKSLAGEVESGSAKLLLSLPHTRRDAVLGKVVGRGATLAASIAVGLVVALVVVLAMYDSFDPAVFLTFSAFTVLLGFVYSGIGVGLSATTKDTGRATILAAGFYIVFEVVWSFVPQVVYYLLNGRFSPPYVTQGPNAPYFDAPGWYLFMQRLAPSSAFTSSVQGFTQSTASFLPPFEGGIPFYLTEWTFLAVLLAWLLVVPLLGYRVFEAADL